MIIVTMKMSGSGMGRHWCGVIYVNEEVTKKRVKKSTVSCVLQ